MKPLVSVIIPCWNAEKLIFRLLDSLLAQTYPNLEVFVVDDGSTDQSVEVVKSYIPKFSDRNNSLILIKQEHSGQSYAMNKALKRFSGDYLVWPDTDDFYSSTQAIEKMVDVFEKSSEDVSMVRTFSDKLDEKTLNKVGENKYTITTQEPQDLFKDCLFGTNGFYYTPGQYMARASVFTSRIPDRQIFEGKYSGQNWQMMLPTLYRKKCVTIPESLYSVLVRNDSSCRWAYKNFDTAVQKNEIRRQGIIYTLNQIKDIPSKERNLLIEKVNNKYDFIHIKMCIKFKKRQELKQCQKKNASFRNRAILLLAKTPLFFSIANSLFK